MEREQQPQEETARLGQARIWDEVVSTIPTLAIEERLAARSLILEPAASSLLAPGSLLKTESCPPPTNPKFIESDSAFSKDPPSDSYHLNVQDTLLLRM